MAVPTATACPKCGSGAYRTVRPPDKVFTFTNYRQCLACQRVYARPTPLWAALAALLVGGGFLSMAVYQFVQGSAKGVMDGLDDAWKAGAMGLTVCSFGMIALVKWQPARARPQGG